MKKSIVLFGIVFLTTFCVSAQNISKNALGLRLGDNDGFGAEVSYQRGLGDNNRLELGLGWRDSNDFDAFRLSGLYQWVWNIDGGFNWYAGAGGGIGNYDVENTTLFEDDSETFIFVAGDIGIEYNFDFPLLISLDFRPEISLNSDINDDLDLDIAVGIRYQF